MTSEYQLNLLKGVDFHELTRDYEVIYDNFHILYYLTDIWQIKILKKISPSSYVFIIYSSKSQNQVKQTYLIEEQNRGQFSCKYDYTHEILYRVTKFKGQSSVNEKENCFFYDIFQEILKNNYKNSVKEQEFSITVKIKAGKRQCDKCARVTKCKILKQNVTEQIQVKIIDHNNFFSFTFSRLHSNLQRGERIFRKKKINKKQIQYFYQEPYEQRYPVIKHEHFSIAFQGGGVKGLSYLGVHEALKKVYKEQTYKLIKNVIGSSAGAIFGLVVICNVSEKQSLEIASLFGKITQSDKINLRQNLHENFNLDKWQDQSREKEEEITQQQFDQIIQEILVGYGIIEKDVYMFIKDILQNDQVINKLINLIKVWNSQISKLLLSDHQPRKLTFLRILRNTLMSGNTVSNIACKCLKNVFPHIPSQNLSLITFKQLFQKTQKQFTCTGVDLTDKMIRFFNEKTTPNMPVASAVQISASFPIAFVGLKWKKQWGKYYIHYDSTRKQIDLTDHLFTDGGLLSNFPIKYLDNDSVRPMYFKNMKDAQYTKIYGFGLMHIENEKSYLDQRQLQINLAIEQFTTALKNVVSCCTAIRYFMCGTISSLFKKCLGIDTVQTRIKPQRLEKVSTNQYIQSINAIQHITYAGFAGQLRQIPLFDFLLNLLDTLVSSDTNFIKQCFSPQCFNTKFPTLQQIEEQGQINPDVWLKKYDHKQFVDGIKKIVDSMRNNDSQLLQQFSEAQINSKKPIQNVLHNLNYLQQALNKKIFDLKESQVIDFAMKINPLVSGIYFQAQTNYFEQQIQNQFVKLLKQWINELNMMCSGKLFHRQDIKRDGYKIQEIIKQLKNYIKKPQQVIKLCIVKVYNKELKSEKKLITCFDQYITRLNSTSKFMPLPIESVIDWTRRQNFQTINMYEHQQQKSKYVDKLIIPQLSIALYGTKVRNKLRGYIHKLLHKSLFEKYQKQNQNKNVHIVLESTHVAQYYFVEFMNYCQEAIFDFNQIKKRTNKNSYQISSITTSGYQSLAAILYASAISKNNMNNYVWKIRESICQISYNQLKTQFKRSKWAQINRKRVLQLEEQVWKSRFDFLGEIRKKYEGTIDNFQIDKQWLIQQKNSKDQINDAFQTVINFALKVIQQSESIPLQNRKQWIRENFSVQKGGRQNYYHKTLQMNHRAIDFFQSLIDKFGDLVKYSLIISCSIAFPMMEHIHDPQTRKEAWRGVIIGKVLTSLKLKSLIKLILKDIGLQPNATLKDFYNSSTKKMLINFIVIESISKKMVILNHNTRPNMPLWAAVIATSSLPYLFEPQMDLNQWKSNNLEQNERYIQGYFKNNKKYEQLFLQSGSFLCKLPLQLITNQKVRKSIGSKSNQVYLSFTFDSFPRQMSDHLLFQTQQKMVLKPLNMYDIINIVRKNTVSDMKQEFLAKGAFNHLNTLKLILDAQDNTYLSLYKAESIQLPTRLSTLNFDRIHCGCQQHGETFSPVVKECIENAQTVTFEKIFNNNPKRSEPCKIFMKIKFRYQKVLNKQFELDKFEQSTNLRFMQGQTVKTSGVEVKNKKITIQFPSAIVQDFYHISQRYKIFYRFKNCPQNKQKKKINFYEKIDQDKTYTQIQGFGFTADLKNTPTCYIDIKIVYVKIQDQRMKLAQVYHQIDLTQLIKAQIQQDKTFTYCIEYTKFYGHQKIQLQPYNVFTHNKYVQQKNYSILINSFNSYFWQANSICDQCGELSSPFSLIGTRKSYKSQCYNKCNNKRYVIFQCKKCEAKFCIYCKYELYFDSESIKCFLGHKVEQKCAIQMKEINYIEQKYRNTDDMKIKICDFCGVYSAVLYHDKECNITICDICKKHKKLSSCKNI